MPENAHLDISPTNLELKRRKILTRGPRLLIPSPTTMPTLRNTTQTAALPSSSRTYPYCKQHIANEEPPSAILYPPPVPIAQRFIKRTKQCVKALCSNVKILADNFMTLAMGQQGVDAITYRVMDFLDTGFVEIFRLPQTAQAEAAGGFLKPLEPYMDSTGIYLHIIKVPANASFREKYEYVFGSGSVDTSKVHVLA